MGYQDNTKALLMTRAMAEMTRLGEKLGGTRQTFGGLAGMGDLIVTCTSMHSRNHRAGILIGQGKTARRPWRRSAPWWRATTPRRASISWRSGSRWKCPSAAASTRCSTRARRSADVVSELMRRAKKDELLETTWL